MFDTLSSSFRPEQTYEDAVSGGVLVAKNGEVLVSTGYGFADREDGRRIDSNSVWDVASITKQFTAAAILVLQQQGKLSLDDTLARFFDNVPDDKRRVTIRQLLAHTSGIANSYEAPEHVDFGHRDSAIGFYLTLPMVTAPGSSWAYSNLAYNLLAAIIETVTAKSWESVVVDDVLRRSGISEAWPLGHPDLPKDRVPKGDGGSGLAFPYGEVSHWAGYRGAGGVHVTLRALHEWDQVLRSERLLSRSNRELLFQDVMDGYALGWRVDTDKRGKRRAWHSGAVPGFISRFVRGLDEDVAVVVLTNTFDPRKAAQLADTLYELATGPS